MASIAGSVGLGVAVVGAPLLFTPLLVTPLLSFCFLAGDVSLKSSAGRLPDIAASEKAATCFWQTETLLGSGKAAELLSHR